MPEWLETIFNLFIFIVCLSTLVMVHEAGHFTAAKFFGVYCDDFSIGFGKALIHKKRKRGETYFSLRVIPFGGFVSMAGEDGELPSGVKVPESRSIKGIKKWKTAIILSAGILMNCVLSLVLFYVSNQFFPVVDVYTNALTIQENSKASESGYKTFNPDDKTGTLVSIQDGKVDGQVIWYYAYQNIDEVTVNGDNLTTYATFNKDGVKTKVPVLGLIQQNKTNIADTSIDNILEFYEYLPTAPEGIDFDANLDKRVDANTVSEQYGAVESITFKFVAYSYQEGKYFCDYLHRDVTIDEIIYDSEKNIYYYPLVINGENSKVPVKENCGLDNNIKPITINVVQDENGNKTLQNAGFSFYSTSYSLSYGEAVSKTFEDFGNGALTIFRALGSLFVGQGWDNVGSIVAIYTQTSSVLNNMGINYFIQMWALISVNLAIFNLLPFPGLDGWQLLVLAIEGITRKKVPDKAKAIASYVGIGLLMLFMVVLIVKDVFMFF